MNPAAVVPSPFAEICRFERHSIATPEPHKGTRVPVLFLPHRQQRHLDSRACAASLSVISQHRFSDCPVASTSSSSHCLRDGVRVGDTKEENG